DRDQLHARARAPRLARPGVPARAVGAAAAAHAAAAARRRLRGRRRAREPARLLPARVLPRPPVQPDLADGVERRPAERGDPVGHHRARDAADLDLGPLHRLALGAERLLRAAGARGARLARGAAPAVAADALPRRRDRGRDLLLLRLLAARARSPDGDAAVGAHRLPAALLERADGAVLDVRHARARLGARRARRPRGARVLPEPAPQRLGDHDERAVVHPRRDLRAVPRPERQRADLPGLVPRQRDALAGGCVVPLPDGGGLRLGRAAEGVPAPAGGGRARDLRRGPARADGGDPRVCSPEARDGDPRRAGAGVELRGRPVAARAQPLARVDLAPRDAARGRWSAPLPARRLAAVRTRMRGRVTAAALVGGYFCLLAALGGYDHWGRLGVFPVDRSRPLWFGDLRSVTSAWECARRGLAVLPRNPCDPWQRPANYPHLWVWPTFLGLGPGDTFALGFVVGAFFLIAALAVLPRNAGVLAGAVYGLALCSPAVMLGVQRGNVDLLLFALLVAAALVAGRALVAGVLVFVAAVLKLFPIFAVGLLLRRARRAAWLVGAAVLAGFAIYAAGTLDTIREIRRVVPQVNDTSFGVRRFSDWAAAALTGHSSPVVWDAAVVVAAVVVALLLRRRLRAHLAPGGERELDLFWAGACVYVASYALYRSFDYRLCFVLMTVPLLLRWSRQRRALAAVTLLALFGTLWLDAPWRGVPLLSWLARSHVVALPPVVLAQLVLFLGLVAGLVATAPTAVPFRVPQLVRSRTTRQRDARSGAAGASSVSSARSGR